MSKQDQFWENEAYRLAGELDASRVELVTAKRELITTNASWENAESRLQLAERDARRLDFLDTLTKRTHTHGNPKTKPWPISSDMHFGPLGVSLYVRTGIGSDCEAMGGGANVREAIDAALSASAGEGGQPFNPLAHEQTR